MELMLRTVPVKKMVAMHELAVISNLFDFAVVLRYGISTNICM